MGFYVTTQPGKLTIIGTEYITLTGATSDVKTIEDYDGQEVKVKMDGTPTQKGVYIKDGKKVVIR